MEAVPPPAKRHAARKAARTPVGRRFDATLRHLPDAIYAVNVYATPQRAGTPVLTKAEVEPQLYRDAMSRFAGAVHVVATDGVAGLRGVTVIAACSVSDQPPTILVCVNARNPGNALFLDNGVFALNSLSAGQEAISVGFSGMTGLSTEERFAIGEWDTIATGAPTLEGALAVFDCELLEAKTMATHHILFGRVKGIRIGEARRPLIYHDRGYHIL